jgi:hypothetical protein
MVLSDLTEHATQREFVYSHSWKAYDLVMWDNRSTMHRARRFDRNEVRDVRRTTLAGEAVVERAVVVPHLEEAAHVAAEPETPGIVRLSTRCGSTPLSHQDLARRRQRLILVRLRRP